jgi:hypothetical protein
MLNLLQPAVSSLVVALWQLSAMEILQLLCSHPCPLVNTPELNCQLLSHHHLFSASLAQFNSHLTGSKVKVEELLFSSSWRQTLETHDQSFFFQVNLCSISLYVTCSLTRRWVLSLINMHGLSSSVRIAHIACYWKFFLLHYIQVLCQYRLCRADHVYLTYLMLQR